MTQQKSERNNNTKKTVVIVALLLALIALLCFGGYTFSKYVTSGNGSGTANVAKWGYAASVDTTKLFGEEYKYDTAKTASTVDGTGASLTVKADTTNRNLVAPGTTGSMTFSFGGTAEVKSQLKVEMSNLQEIVLNVKSENTVVGTYNPVKWTLTKKVAGNTTIEVDNGTLEAVKTALNKTTVNNANVTVEETEYTLTWAWAFENTAVDTALSGKQFTADILDTCLGKYSASNTNNTVTINGTEYTLEAKTVVGFELSISVTQLAE